MAEAKATAQVFDARSGRKSSMDLSGPQFETEPREHVIHRAVVAELDSRRRYTASTRGRSEVRGSGAKLYRQKGTGRARAGDVKSPIRVGGGKRAGSNCATFFAPFSIFSVACRILSGAKNSAQIVAVATTMITSSSAIRQ